MARKKINLQKEQTPQKQVNYEMVTIFTKDVASPSQSFLDVLRKVNADVISQNDWGLRLMTYSISHKTNGHYYLFILQLPTNQEKELVRLLQMETNILRFLVIRPKEVTKKLKT